MTTPFRAIAAVLAAFTAAACSEPASAPGPDRSTGSQASTVAWPDGKPAIAISCDAPAGCQQRASAMCGGGHTTLKSENMPTVGAIRVVQGPPSIVIRCN